MQQWQVGDVTVTSVVELEATIPGTFMIPKAEAAAVQQHEWLQPHFAAANGDLVIRIQMLVLESEGRRIAIDTCVGNDKDRTNPVFHRMQLPFLEHLETAGFEPGSIDTVICTHLHQDHVGWNTMLVDGKWVPTFPNARYLFGTIEWDHWLAHGIHADGDVFGDSVRPVMDAGQADLVELGYEVTSEVRLEPTPGHSPGSPERAHHVARRGGAHHR